MKSGCIAARRKHSYPTLGLRALARTSSCNEENRLTFLYTFCRQRSRNVRICTQVAECESLKTFRINAIGNALWFLSQLGLKFTKFTSVSEPEDEPSDCEEQRACKTSSNIGAAPRQPAAISLRTTKSRESMENFKSVTIRKMYYLLRVAIPYWRRLHFHHLAHTWQSPYRVVRKSSGSVPDNTKNRSRALVYVSASCVLGSNCRSHIAHRAKIDAEPRGTSSTITISEPHGWRPRTKPDYTCAPCIPTDTASPSSPVTRSSDTSMFLVRNAKKPPFGNLNRRRPWTGLRTA